MKTLRVNFLALRASIIVSLVLLAGASAWAGTITHTISISPGQPKDEWQVDLQPGATASLTVNVAETGDASGKSWKIKGTPEVNITGTDIIWSGSLVGFSGVFSVVNTAPGTTTTTVKVSCTWVPNGAGGGTGGGGAPLEGLATGVAIPGVAHVSWSFYPTLQLADGSSAINWAIYFYTAEGVPVSTVVSAISAVALRPAGAAWNITPTSGTGSVLTGTVTSSNVSNGRLSVHYSGSETAVSDTILNFATQPYLEVYTPLE